MLTTPLQEQLAATILAGMQAATVPLRPASTTGQEKCGGHFRWPPLPHDHFIVSNAALNRRGACAEPHSL
jgi:hypothetical protein